MSGESFDFDEIDNLASQSTVTAWSAHVAPKGRVKKTYGRRGSTGVLPSSMAFSRQPELEEPLDLLSPTKEETSFEVFSPPTFKRDAPTIPGRRRFTRANSISTLSRTSSLQPSQPTLRRCVSTSMSSVGSSSRSSFQSRSLSSNFEDSISESGVENEHPNMSPLDVCASPKRGALLKDSRGRKKSRSDRNLSELDSPALPPMPALPPSSSFSNLARADSLTWVKNPPAPPVESSPFSSRPRSWTEMDESPALSSVGSTRKRGICESPFEDYDDMFASAPSVSSTRRTISRTALLSPPLDRSGHFNLDNSDRVAEFSQHSASKAKKSDAMDMVSDDGDSGAEADSSDDLSIENKRLRRSPVPTFVPFHQRQKTYASARVAASKPPKAVVRSSARPEDVIESMPSYNDLKFLAKKLKKERVYSQVNLCVPLPTEWTSHHRADFIQWGTNHLGFKVNSGGAQLVYLQISKSKGITLLQLLEDSVAFCKEQGLARKTPKHPSSGAKDLFNLGFTPISNVAPKTPKE